MRGKNVKDKIKIFNDKKRFKAIREALADYLASEGCSCFRDSQAHKEAGDRLGKLLKVPAYKDKSGYDFSKYRSKKK